MDEQSQLCALMDAADDPAYDEVFDRLAHGRLSAEEAEELRTSDDPEIRRLYELFKPADARAKRRFDDAVARAFATAGSGRPEAIASLPLQVAPKPLRAPRRTLPAVLALAVAAGLVLYLAYSRQSPQPVAQIEPPAKLKVASLVPRVAYSRTGSAQLGDDGTRAEPTQLPAGYCWRFQLDGSGGGRLPKPESIRVFLVQANVAVDWNVTFEALDNNRIGPVSDCATLPALAPGPWEMFILSGTDVPALTPAEVAATCAKSATDGAGWRCDSERISILPPSNE